MCFARERAYRPPATKEETAMTNPTAAMLVIGDEILSGRTRDANFHHLAQELTRAGIDLGEMRVVADDHAAIVAAVRALGGTFDHLFTSGGIGPTHDDITADAVAEAMGADIGPRADAMALLRAHYEARGQDLNAARQRMARIPTGATLIDNPVSAAPGFTIGNVHVLAGVPEIFRAMLSALLPGLRGGTPVTSRTLRLARGEGDIADAFRDLAVAYPELSMGSYPSVKDGVLGTSLVIRGTDARKVDEAMARLVALFG